MAGYRIFTDATADLSEALLEGLPPVTVIPMEVEVGGTVRVWAGTLRNMLPLTMYACSVRLLPRQFLRVTKVRLNWQSMLITTLA